MSQVKNWIFTLNNPTESPEEFADKIEALSAFKYLSFQVEVGENGTEHFQGISQNFLRID